MNQTLKRALSGAMYVAIMWFGTSYSELSFHILFSVILVVCLYEMGKLRKGKTKIIAFLYVLVPLTLVHQIDRELILFMFIITWTFDTFAYLVGVQCGKHKIMPSVSPKKSWEGFAGGAIFTILAAYLSYQYFGFNSFRDPLIISILLPFTATLGDFLESYYKRKAGAKDSGNFIPGHGGMLDRMDAFTITISVIYLLTNLL
jgi:phosphatidate cytidylyltransferase